MEKRTNNIRILRNDNGCEYFNKEFDSYLRKVGFLLIFSGYNSYKNISIMEWRIAYMPLQPPSDTNSVYRNKNFLTIVINDVSRQMSDIYRETLSGPIWHVLSYEVCEYKVHRGWAQKKVQNCKWITLAAVRKDIMEEDEYIVMPHQWMEGNLSVVSV
ncbi:unnamed protein product [Hermetia illucens]|uniref:Uncharacterized protein n=1 Tax=Hermetia illucens TaxID=343691 RepID=A0A7R8V209_HERIL|nr:unnamed protein product [Hermetia illucens]